MEHRQKFVGLIEGVLLKRGGFISLDGLLKILRTRGYSTQHMPEALRQAGFDVDEEFNTVRLPGVKL